MAKEAIPPWEVLCRRSIGGGRVWGNPTMHGKPLETTGHKAIGAKVCHSCFCRKWG